VTADSFFCADSVFAPYRFRSGSDHARLTQIVVFCGGSCGSHPAVGLLHGLHERAKAASRRRALKGLSDRAPRMAVE
jgi:hypothetical protein